MMDFCLPGLRGLWYGIRFPFPEIWLRNDALNKKADSAYDCMRCPLQTSSVSLVFVGHVAVTSQLAKNTPNGIVHKSFFVTSCAPLVCVIFTCLCKFNYPTSLTLPQADATPGPAGRARGCARCIGIGHLSLRCVVTHCARQ